MTILEKIEEAIFGMQQSRSVSLFKEIKQELEAQDLELKNLRELLQVTRELV